jgi:hypothetical protein
MLHRNERAATHLHLSRDSPTDLFTPTKKTKNSVAFSPQANYTDRANAACRQS